MNAPTPASSDILLQQYEQAKALLPDGLPEQASAAARARIMQAARVNGGQQESSDAPELIADSAHSNWSRGQKDFKNEVSNLLQSTSKQTAANDSFWSIKAVASIVVMGLSALLLWQFEQVTPEEKQEEQTARPQLEATTPATGVTPSPYSAPPAKPATASEASPANSPAAALRLPPRRADAVPSLTKPENAAVAAAQPAGQAREQSSPHAMQESTPAPAAVHPAAQTAAVEKAIRPSAAALQFKQQTEAIASAEVNTARDTASGARSAPLMRAPTATATPAAPAQAAGAAPAASREPSPHASPTDARTIAATPEQRIFSAIEVQDLNSLQATLQNHPAIATAVRADGQTPLHISAQRRWLEGVRALMAAGANPDAQNKQGQTPKDLASGEPEILKLLKP